MLNRNAEALFWIGRYMERAENHARLVDVHYHIQHEGDFAHEEHKWSRLVDAFGARGDYLQQFEQFTERDVISFITLDRGYGNSLFSCVSLAHHPGEGPERALGGGQLLLPVAWGGAGGRYSG
jgi:uncharacterized alpha-E superfamily protein